MGRPRCEIDVVPMLAGGVERRAELLPHTRELLARADFRRLERDLAERRLLTLIGSRAIDAAPDLVPDAFRAAVARALTEARARGLAVEAATLRAVRCLAADGIRALPLKGPLLAHDAHGDVGLRETSDIDLLVRADQLTSAADILRDLGYGEPVGARRANDLPDLHFELGHPSEPPIDLHWRVYWYERAFSERMLAEAEPGADDLLRPQPEDLVASLLLFFARDGFHGVRHPADLAAWWDAHGDEMPARFLEERAAAYPGIAPALHAAALVASRLVGLPAVEWLGAAGPLGRRVGLATRLADWRQEGDRDQLMANMSLVGGLLGPPGSLHEFARRELTLPGEGTRAGALHAAKVSARYGIALWRARAGRQWTEPPV